VEYNGFNHKKLILHFFKFNRIIKKHKKQVAGVNVFLKAAQEEVFEIERWVSQIINIVIKEWACLRIFTITIIQRWFICFTKQVELVSNLDVRLKILQYKERGLELSWNKEWIQYKITLLQQRKYHISIGIKRKDYKSWLQVKLSSWNYDNNNY
jgi:hypothetical protein